MDFTLNLEKMMKYYTSSGAFLTVKADGKVNTMTVSWGFVGYFWQRPHFIVGVRPQRFTKHIMDNAESFTLSVPYGTMKEELNICGTKSGADIDKSKVVEFVSSKHVESPVVKDCDMYYECKISKHQQLDGKDLPEFIKSMYKDDFHFFYFGEIIDCYAGKCL